MKKSGMLLLGLFMVVLAVACDDSVPRTPDARNNSNYRVPNIGTTPEGPSSNVGVPGSSVITLADLSEGAQSSGMEFDTLMNEVVDNCEEESCQCPVSGSVSPGSEGDPYRITFSDCKSENGMIFSGTVTLSEDDTQFNAMFTEFGDCLNVEMLGVNADECKGIFKGACEADFINCMFHGNSEDNVCGCSPDVM